MAKERQILRFNGYEGSFTIESGSLIYEIILQNGEQRSVCRNEDMPPVTTLSREPVAGQQEEFYHSISQEMYQEVGRLAKSLSSSLRDITLEELKSVDLPVTGAEIEDAREDLESVVKMTETATLNIMDLLDTIQEDCQTVQKNVEAIQDLSALKSSPPEELVGRLESQLGSMAELRSTLAGMLDEKKAALAHMGQPSASEKEVAASEGSEQKGFFSLDVLLQTLYEFCTSEDYKAKIKLMRERQDELFEAEILQERLRQGAAGLEEEDGLYPFAVTYLLEQLEETCTNPKVQSFISTFLESAESLFLDSTLPLEIRSPPENGPEPVPATDDSPPLSPAATILQGDIERLEAMLAQLEQSEALGATVSQLREFSFIKSEDETTLMKVMEQSSQAAAKTGTAITGIMEALSFQDLSGQRILKIIQLLKGVQLQLLSIMLAHHTRVKEKSKQPEITVKEQERLVQSEIDRTLSELTVSEPAEDQDGEKFDQDKVDELLAEMGF